jgi:hypothetical protein
MTGMTGDEMTGHTGFVDRQSFHQGFTRVQGKGKDQ